MMAAIYRHYVASMFGCLLVIVAPAPALAEVARLFALSLPEGGGLSSRLVEIDPTSGAFRHIALLPDRLWLDLAGPSVVVTTAHPAAGPTPHAG